MSKFFTRLTSNSRKWVRPSGLEGKCNSEIRLYEESYGFGWEEWLFEDYHKGKDTCLGFLQGFNGKNNDATSIELIHLYTRLCDGVTSKLYYVGHITDVKILSQNQRAASEATKKKRITELNAVGINNFPTNDSMWNKAYNIQFERNNVYLQKDHLQCEITLNRGQFRFALYDLNNHLNFITQINNYL
jgi:hypothetical protein